MGQAIRRLSAGKHIGKVLLQFCDQNGTLLPSCKQIPFIPSSYCRADASYLLVGGTGGLGVTVASWLADHGARHILLVSRSGKVHATDQLMLNRVIRQGVEVTVKSVDATDKERLTECLDEYQSTHPSIRGVMHTAMVLRDGLIHSLNENDIETSLAVKVTAG